MPQGEKLPEHEASPPGPDWLSEMLCSCSEVCREEIKTAESLPVSIFQSAQFRFSCSNHITPLFIWDFLQNSNRNSDSCGHDVMFTNHSIITSRRRHVFTCGTCLSSCPGHLWSGSTLLPCNDGCCQTPPPWPPSCGWRETGGAAGPHSAAGGFCVKKKRPEVTGG